MLFGKFQGFQGLRAAIDNIADQPKGVRTILKPILAGNKVSSSKTALNVSDLRNVPLLLFPLLLFQTASSPAQAV